MSYIQRKFVVFFKTSLHLLKPILMVAIWVGLLLPSAASAQSITWSNPTMLGPTWFPAIATDSSGAVHIAWADGDDMYDLVMYTNNASGQGWLPTNDIQAMPAPYGRYATRPDLLVDPNNVLHMSYRGDTIWYTNVPVTQADDTQSWSTPQAVVSAGYFSEMAYSKDGTLHLFFTENKPRADCTNCFHMMYQSTKDGINWTNPVDLTPTFNGVAKPQAIIDSQNNIHLVFEAGYGGDIGQLADPATVMHMSSFDGGNTWTLPTRFAPERGDTPAAQARNVAIGEDKSHNLVAVWWAIPEDTIYYQVSQNFGKTWSSPQAVPGVVGMWNVYQSRLDIFSLAADSAGTLHLVMNGRHRLEDSGVNVFHLEWNGANWSTPETIAAYDGDVPEWPRIAIGNGNQLHVVWFVRDYANLFFPDTSNYRVWYASGQSSAPAIAPIAIAQPAPTAAVMPTVVSQEAFTDTLATYQLDESLKQPADKTVSINLLKTENDDLALLGMSVLPIVGLLALITLVRRRKRA